MANTPKKFSISFKFNGEVIQKRTDDINEAILAVKPDVIHTDVYITAKDKKGWVAERKLNLTQAKRVFRDDITREVFINNLLVAHVN